MLQSVVRGAIAAGAGLAVLLPCGIAMADGNGGGKGETATPIKHVIILIGENRTFDNIYATYRPNNKQTVLNLLSQGIITAILLLSIATLILRRRGHRPIQ